MVNSKDQLRKLTYDREVLMVLPDLQHHVMANFEVLYNFCSEGTVVERFFGTGYNLEIMLLRFNHCISVLPVAGNGPYESDLVTNANIIA